MQQYSDSRGRSGVLGYDVGNDFVTVHFKDGSAYKYTYESAGARVVGQMKRFAKKGSHLNAYINKNARNRYSEKIL
jgi:hypothetical protein